jgi:hypothetical protein
MCVAGVDGAEVTGRAVAVQVVLRPDGVEGTLRPSTFPEVRALCRGDDPEPTWCSRRWLHPLILSETRPALPKQPGPADVPVSRCRAHVDGERCVSPRPKRLPTTSGRLPNGPRK